MERIGVIGGSGLYEMDGVEIVERKSVSTPFGAPSDELIFGRLEGRELVFLPRHGVGHRLLPGEVNYRANIWALKSVGVAQIVSVSAVGSLQEEIRPGDFVFVDQFIDRTRHRPQTFLGDGLVAHVSFGDPVCGPLQAALREASKSVPDLRTHDAGTYVCIEGPQFSARAESELFRRWGAHVVGMTNLPEARLAREAELSYATVALVTDYDCWHESEEEVSVDAVLSLLRTNVGRAQALIRAYCQSAPEGFADAPARTALRSGMLTPKERIPAEVIERLAPILRPVLDAPV